MIRDILSGVVIFAMSLLGLELLSGSGSPLDTLVRWIYWIPITPLHQLPDLVAPVVGLLPVIFLFPFLFMLLVGLLGLAEMN
jgi:hypothetical protein